jgi:hypothetical protein
MSEPKLHHVVPQFYLKRFARDGEIELVAKDDPKNVVPTGVPAALAWKHFYTVDTAHGRDTSAEKMFATYIEGPAKRAFDRVIDRKKPCAFPGLRFPIAAFLAFQFVRGPAARRASVELCRATARKVLTMFTPEMVLAALRREGKHISLAEAEAAVDFARNGTYRIEPSSDAAAHLGIALKAGLDLIPLFMERPWVVVEFATPALLTGDEPLGLIGRSGVPGEGLGIVDAQEIVFPTDPWHALILRKPDRGRRDGRCSGTKPMADLINAHVAFSCDRFLVRYPGTDPLRGLSVPRKAPPVVTVGDTVSIQPRTSIKQRKAWLRRQRPRR